MPKVASRTAQRTSLMFEASPFNLNDEKAYAAWRAKKIASAQRGLKALTVKITDWRLPSKSEIIAVAARCENSNFAIYKVADDLCKENVTALAASFGLKSLEMSLLNDEDGIAELSTDGIEGTTRSQYIPYSNKPLSWHTDGYYNPVGHWVLGMLLHCVKPAETGGLSQLLDPDIAYMRLRDKNPEWVSALMHKEALTIPANDLEVKGGRNAKTGPVFSIIDGDLAMRYTHRTRSAIWRNDPVTTEARAFLRDILENGDEFMLTHRLSAGEGIISNNVLHRRTGFEDTNCSSQGRLLYRARFRDRVRPITTKGG